MPKIQRFPGPRGTIWEVLEYSTNVGTGREAATQHRARWAAIGDRASPSGQTGTGGPHPYVRLLRYARARVRRVIFQQQ